MTIFCFNICTQTNCPLIHNCTHLISDLSIQIEIDSSLELGTFLDYLKTVGSRIVYIGFTSTGNLRKFAPWLCYAFYT
jgi:hypothetical protein